MQSIRLPVRAVALLGCWQKDKAGVGLLYVLCWINRVGVVVPHVLDRHSQHQTKSGKLTREYSKGRKKKKEKEKREIEKEAKGRKERRNEGIFFFRAVTLLLSPPTVTCFFCVMFCFFLAFAAGRQESFLPEVVVMSASVDLWRPNYGEHLSRYNTHVAGIGLQSSIGQEFARAAIGPLYPILVICSPYR